MVLAHRRSRVPSPLVVTLTLLIFHRCLSSVHSVNSQKTDCYPELPAPTREQCSSRNCIFDPDPSPGQPACHRDEQNEVGLHFFFFEYFFINSFVPLFDH